MDFFTLLIILFIVSRVVEALRGQGTQPPKTPPGQRQRQAPPRAPGQLPRQPRPEPSARGDAPSPSAETDRAAGMIPDDLWEILTGEKRQPPPAPVPPPEPEPEPREEGFDPWAEGLARDEDALVEDLQRTRAERRTRNEDSQVDRLLARRRADLADRAPERTSKVVSLFTEPPASDIRHARFHRRLEKLQVQPEAPRARPARRLGLHGKSDLRRAIVLTEVLGRPKALEEPRGPG